MSRCRSCNAEVIWGLSTNDKPMIIDPAPVANGNLALTWQGDKVLVEVAGPSDSEPRYVVHQFTCPDAPKWKRGRRAQR